MPDEIGHVGYPDVNVTELAERMDRFSDPREDGGSTGVPISNVVDQQEYTSMRDWIWTVQEDTHGRGK